MKGFNMAMQLSDANFVISERGSIHAYDLRSTKTEASALAYRLMNERGKPFDVEECDEFTARVDRHYFDLFKLAEITEEFHAEMLNCLPPMHRRGAMGFFMCEMTTGTLTSQFASYRGKYHGACVDLRKPETWITPEKIDALESAAPLTWFPKGAE